MADMKRAEVLVYGAGAVGSIFGWRLAHRGQARVSLVCRSNYEQVKATGFTFQTQLWGNGLLIPHQVYKAGSISDQPSHRGFDYIILANKIKTKENSDSMVRELTPLMHEGTTLVSAQNGMDNETPFRDAFPRNTILSAVCNFVCAQPRSGFVEQTAGIKPHAFHIGIHGQGKEVSPADITRRDLLVAMDSRFKAIDSAHDERWQKLVFNSAWNSMTALTGINTRELFAHPSAIEIVRHLAREAYSVGIASGVKLPAGLPEKTIELARTSGPITTSTLQDARKGRPLELGPIFGYIVSQAAKVGVLIPYTTMVYDQLQQMNRAFLAQQPPPRPTFYEELRA
ncbi:2-dehydropantoate 2-reductase-like protein [Polychaeton citri CBS 116435]|uniref:2-dehydropantoate 2-reductase n=1 Tax=Polychaeton citri CBS 116435 TaxID=1314669 RepID=A0A9P4ULV8_9PEZI|nr:2-dehydropantoate 2-reductase-like protein [Polychaeton citri CBS 116435]